ncbi:hypothetical protein ACFPJ1_15510 [Kribbella qitaiheensis]|uniref:hypothetical protein n=1 Tax=Kribbella qitaiheensis TaxID=1544730 RepID=UPI0036100B8A
MWKPWGRKRSSRPPAVPASTKSPDSAQADDSSTHRQAPPAEVANLRARLTSEGFSYRH